MGGIVGGVTDALGMTDVKGAGKAGAMAGEANKKALQWSQENIDIQKEILAIGKEQFADWTNIYGDVEENLGDYYKNLNADTLIAMGLEKQQKEYQMAVKTMQREAGQRGISGSGLEYAAKSAATFQNAEARARIRTNAPAEVAAQKLGFLEVGLNKRAQDVNLITGAAGNVNQAYNVGVGSRNAVYSGSTQQNTQKTSDNNNAMGDLIGIGLSFL